MHCLSRFLRGGHSVFPHILRRGCSLRHVHRPHGVILGGGDVPVSRRQRRRLRAHGGEGPESRSDGDDGFRSADTQEGSGVDGRLPVVPLDATSGGGGGGDVDGDVKEAERGEGQEEVIIPYWVRKNRAIDRAFVAHNDPTALKLLFNFDSFYQSGNQDHRCIHSIIQQLADVRMFNLASEKPAALTMCGLKEGPMRDSLHRCGVLAWKELKQLDAPIGEVVQTVPGPVFMSPDARHPLENTDAASTYIIGMIADGNFPEPFATEHQARQLHMPVKRLPLAETFFGRSRSKRTLAKKHPLRPARYNLTISTATSALIDMHVRQDWRATLVRTLSYRESNKIGLFSVFNVEEHSIYLNRRKPRKYSLR